MFRDRRGLKSRGRKRPPVDTGQADAPEVTFVEASEITVSTAKISWGLTKFATGHVEWGPTTSYGDTNFPAEESFEWSNHIQTITGLDSDTEYHYRVFGEDELGLQYFSEDQVFTTLAEEPTDPPDPPPAGQVGPIYGVPAFMMTLNNARVGYQNWSWALRFRAEHTGSITAVRHHWQLGSGYSAGDGGTYRMSLQPCDSNGLPTGQILASRSNYSMPGGSGNTGFNVSFSSPGSVVEGNLYAIVWENLHSNKTSNYGSLNTSQGGLGSRSPEWDDDPRWHGFSNDLALLNRVGTGSWVVGGAFSLAAIPNHDIAYSDGYHQGFGYVEYWIGINSNGPLRKTVSGSNNKIRERITPSQDVTITSIFMGAKRINSGTDPLIIELQNVSRTPIETLSIPATTHPVRTLSESQYRAPDDVWGAVLSQPRTLIAGQTYYVECRTESGTQYSFMAMRRGRDWGYHPTTYFDDGDAFITSNNFSSQTSPIGWSGSTSYSDELDWKIFMDTLDSSSPGEPPVISNVVTIPAITECTVEWDIDRPVTGQVEWGTTTSYGSSTALETNLLTFHRQTLTPLSPNTTYFFRITGEDANGIGTEHTGSFQTEEEPDTPPPVSGTDFVGIAYALTDKSNRQCVFKHAIRFHTVHGGTVSTLRFQATNRDEPYGGGNAGIYTVGIQSVDANRMPTGTWIGNTVTWDPVIVTSPQNFGVRLDWSGPTLDADETYAIVWENTATNPSTNRTSLNFPWLSNPPGPQPLYPNDDNAFLDGGQPYVTNGNWQVNDNHLPAFDLTYTSGKSEGLAAIRGVEQSDRVGIVSSSSACRWTFTQLSGSAQVVVDAFNLWMWKQSGSTNATIAVRINGVVEATGTLTGSGSLGSGSRGWCRAVLSSPVTIAAGDAVRVDIETTSGTYWLPLTFLRDASTSSGEHMQSFPYQTADGTGTTSQPFRADDSGGAVWSAWYSHTSFMAYFEVQ